MKTKQIQTQKGEKITSNIHWEFFSNPGNSMEFEPESQSGDLAIENYGDPDLSSMDSETRKWFLRNLYINDTAAWAKDYKRRIHSSEVFF